MKHNKEQIVKKAIKLLEAKTGKKVVLKEAHEANLNSYQLIVSPIKVEDSFEEGEIGKEEHYSIDKYNAKASNPREAIKQYIQSEGFDYKEERLTSFDETIVYSTYVDENDIEFSETQMNDWKKGEQRLWTMDFYFEVYKLELERIYDI